MRKRSASIREEKSWASFSRQRRGRAMDDTMDTCAYRAHSSHTHTHTWYHIWGEASPLLFFWGGGWKMKMVKGIYVLRVKSRLIFSLWRVTFFVLLGFSFLFLTKTHTHTHTRNTHRRVSTKNYAVVSLFVLPISAIIGMPTKCGTFFFMRNVAGSRFLLLICTYWPANHTFAHDTWKPFWQKCVPSDCATAPTLD